MTFSTLPDDDDAIAARLALHAACGGFSARAGAAVWHSVGRLALAATSSSLDFPAPQAVRRLLQESHCLAAIFWTNAPSGKPSIRRHLPVASLQERNPSRQFRQKVRKGLAVFTVRRMSWHEWRTMGLSCDRSTLARRGQVAAPLLNDESRARVAALATRAGSLEIYGCFAGADLTAYLVCHVHERICEGLIMHWDDGCPDAHATHALYHGFLEAQVGRTDIDDILGGGQWIFPNVGGDFFKRQAGFIEHPCHVGVLLHPWLAPVLETRMAALVCSALRRLLAPYWAGAQKLELIELAWRTCQASRCNDQ